MVCLHTPHWLATSPTVRPSARTARTALYLCSVTLISLMARECRVGTEVAVTKLPKVCRTAAEGVLSPRCRTYTAGWCRGPGSNWGHRDFQSRALPTELPRHGGQLYRRPNDRLAGRLYDSRSST